ncbi:MAG: L-histidine N(alpha)-methyltransferase [Rhodospirillales bacterium]|nr:L-histidine N(alpha)-methyltransferase [Rhodospirillales bacterium]
MNACAQISFDADDVPVVMRRSVVRAPERTRHGFLKEEFKQAVLGLFHRKDIQGPMGSYMYAAPLSSRDPVRGSEYWEAAAADPSYRFLRDEEEILRDARTHSWIESNLPQGATVVDLACGVAAEKAEQIVGALCGVSSYVAVDQTESFARRTAEMVKEAFPRVRANFIVHDIINGGAPDIREEITNPVLVLFGGLLANGVWPSGAGKNDVERLTMVMKEVARGFSNQNPFFRRKGHIISTWQVCDSMEPDEFRRAVEDSYNKNPFFPRVLLNGLKLIKSDLKVKGLDCGAFSFRADWVPAQMRVRLNVVSSKDQDFVIEGHQCHLDAGEPVTLVNSFKFNQAALDAIFNHAGFGPVTHLSIPDNQIDLVITEAPPEAWRVSSPGGHLKVRTSFISPSSSGSYPVERFCHNFISGAGQSLHLA